MEDHLVRRPTFRSRNAVAYLTLRSWRASCRRAALDLFKAEKKAKTPAVLAAVGEELAMAVRDLLYPVGNWIVASVACGHSRDPDCWGKLLARSVAAHLGLPFSQVFEDRFISGSSHPMEHKKLPPLQWASLPAGPVLLIDDLVTSGWHMQEALEMLRSCGVPALGAAWIGGTVEDAERVAGPEAWPAWFAELPDWQEVARGLRSLDELPVGPLAR